MSFDWINPFMLFGLMGIALPILAHLLSKKTYDVVDWGAMQFLELGHEARRRVRLEDLLLLLLRMGLVALLAVALARPWISGAFLGRIVSKQNRDIVLIIDGSYSMGRNNGAMTPHAAAIQWTHEFLETLQPGDTVALLDARDSVRSVVEPPVRDLSIVRHALDSLPPPAGGVDLAATISHAGQLLCRTSNVSREIIVITDGQARGWRAGDEAYWTRLDDLRQQAAVPPRVWVVNVLRPGAANEPNCTVGRLRLSRELTVTGFPITVQTTVGYTGSAESSAVARPVERHVYFEVDGQRLAEKTANVQLLPGGEASVDFEYRFHSTGSHLIRISVDDDSLPGDNQSEAAVWVAEAIPILLVNGQPDADPTRTETFFAKAALSASSNRAPWINATVVDAADFDSRQLDHVEAVFLCNVPSLDAKHVSALSSFVARGGGLCVCIGDRVDRESYNQRLFKSGAGLLPASLVEVASDTAVQGKGVRVADDSLIFPWTTRFRSDQGGTLTHARFERWMTIQLPEKNAATDAGPSDTAPRATPRVIARFDTGAPFLVARRHHRGDVFLFTSSLDADWNTLPAKPDYVAFLHEIVFQLATGTISRNVDVGVPLVASIPQEADIQNYVFVGPGDTPFPAVSAGDELRRQAKLDDTRLPGVYMLKCRDDTNAPQRSNQYFVVNSDRLESDLTPLSHDERQAFEESQRLRFVSTAEQLRIEMSDDDSKTEFWHLLLYVFLIILIGELMLTRRLVQGGHALQEEQRSDTERFINT